MSHSPRQRSIVRLSSLILAALVAVATFLPVRPASARVQTLTGNYTYSRVDSSVAASLLYFERTYNSIDTRMSVLGPGWTHRFNVRLVHPDGYAPDDRMFVGPQGRQELYTAKPDGTFEPSTFAQGTLTKEPDAESGYHYVMTQQDGSIYRILPTGRVVEIGARMQPGLALTYDDRGNLASVTDTYLKATLTFAYSDAGDRLVEVADGFDPPRIVRFGYDDLNRLSTVTNRVGQVTRYTYVGATHHLHEIVDARGHPALTMEYDERGVTRRQWNARGLQEDRSITFDYLQLDDGRKQTVTTEPPSGFAPTTPTTFVDTYDEQGRIARREITSVPGDEPVVEIYGPTAGAPWGVTSRSGGKTPAPAAGGQPLTEVAVPGVTPPLEVKVGKQLLPNAPLPPFVDTLPKQHVDALRRFAPRFRTDRAGRVISFDVPTNLERFGGTWRVEYDGEDRVLALANEATGEHTAYHYDEVGNLVEGVGPDGASTTYEYDERDSLVAIHATDGTTTRYEYDERYHLARSIAEPAGSGPARVVAYQHDGLGRLRLVQDLTDPAAPVTTELTYNDRTVSGIWQR